MRRPAVLIFDPAQGEAHAETLRRLGCSAEIVDSPEIEPAEMPDAVVVGDADAVRSVRRADPAVPVILALESADIDAAASFLGIAQVEFVVAPWTDEGFATALATLRMRPPRPSAFMEGDAGYGYGYGYGYGFRLAALGEEIARIARAIEPPAAAADAPPVPEAPLAFDPAVVRKVLKSRRQRDALFAPGTFADPAWDMLLDLTAARGEGKPVAVSSLAIAASVPPTTALRHLKAMVEAGLVVRRADPEDGRRAYIDLSDDAFARMRAWVAALPKTV